MTEIDREVTLADALHDPVVQAVMRSDHIEEWQLIDLMSRVAGSRRWTRQRAEADATLDVVA